MYQTSLWNELNELDSCLSVSWQRHWRLLFAAWVWSHLISHDVCTIQSLRLIAHETSSVSSLREPLSADQKVMAGFWLRELAKPRENQLSWRQWLIVSWQWQGGKSEPPIATVFTHAHKQPATFTQSWSNTRKHVDDVYLLMIYSWRDSVIANSLKDDKFNWLAVAHIFASFKRLVRFNIFPWSGLNKPKISDNKHKPNQSKEIKISKSTPEKHG